MPTAFLNTTGFILSVQAERSQEKCLTTDRYEFVIVFAATVRAKTERRWERRRGLFSKHYVGTYENGRGTSKSVPRVLHGPSNTRDARISLSPRRDGNTTINTTMSYSVRRTRRRRGFAALGFPDTCPLVVIIL